MTINAQKSEIQKMHSHINRNILFLSIAVIFILSSCQLFSNSGTASLSGTYSDYYDDNYIEFNYPEGWYVFEAGEFDGLYVGTNRDVRDLDDILKVEEGEFYMMILFEIESIEENELSEYAEDLAWYFDEEILPSEIKDTKVNGMPAKYVSLKGYNEYFEATIEGNIIVWLDENPDFGNSDTNNINVVWASFGFSGGYNFQEYEDSMDGIINSIDYEFKNLGEAEPEIILQEDGTIITVEPGK